MILSPAYIVCRLGKDQRAWKRLPRKHEDQQASCKRVKEHLQGSMYQSAKTTKERQDTDVPNVEMGSTENKKLKVSPKQDPVTHEIQFPVAEMLT